MLRTLGSVAHHGSAVFSLGCLGLILGSEPCTPKAFAQVTGTSSSIDRTTSTKPFAFEVVSVRLHKPGSEPLDRKYLPNGYTATLPLESAIALAYLPQGSPAKAQFVNEPDWVSRDWYDVEARVAEEDLLAWQQAQRLPFPDSDLLYSGLRAMLSERFKLILHITPVEVPYLNIVVDKHGAKLSDTVPGAVKPVPGKTSAVGKGFYIQDNGKAQFVGVTMADLATALMRLDRSTPIQDKTGLSGRYDFTLPWYGYQNNAGVDFSAPLDRMPIASVGLMLKPGKGSSFIITIDHIEKPDPN